MSNSTVSTQAIYIVIHSDRHSDTEVHAFADRDAAIKAARQIAEEYARAKDDIEEHSVSDWEYYASYSPESDRVWVVKVDVK